ncbi:RdgB/HAM1 family non-canonical purine NTP pyrophosphatase [bacterium]|nr:RdgB/HAM1 family non-canonical purine NTP pyrophosphatase [bacterium]
MSENHRRILAATQNKDKLREIRQILEGSGWDVAGLDDFPPYPETVEDGETLLENALLKARDGYRHTRLITLADDSGLEVDGLNGRPGIHSARYAGENATYEDNVDLLLRELEDVPESERTARFRCVMALIGPDIERWWEGVSEGIIIDEKRGKSGFGYDPVFWSPELGMTFAEATAADKNRVSHRGRALKGLVNVLDELV